MGESDNGRVARRALVVIGLVLATITVLFLGYEARRVLTWIVIAGFFAVALHPAVTWMTRRVTFCKRWLATLLVFVTAFAVLGGLVTLFVVPLAREGSQVIADFPRVVEDMRNGRGPAGSLIERFHLLEYAQNNADRIREYASGLGAPTLAFLRSMATGVAGIATIFVLSYLMVLEAPKIVDGFLALFSSRRAEHIRRVGHDCAKTITGYITGNLLISVVCGTLTYVVLAVMDVPYAGLIALFVGLADLIPLVGATLGAVIATAAAFVGSTTAGIVVLVFFVLYQQLENHLLQPLIFARTVKLNPLTVLVAILIAVELAGILGALLAIPVAGILQILARDIWDTRRGRPKSEPTVGEGRTPVSVAGDDRQAERAANAGARDTHAAYAAMSDEPATPHPAQMRS
ncbi:AI-2E family transporter [Actinoplanes xinjiangensis]|uniref:Putative PurR-regulated permease PerM n=1 Tax=Actinoplanes xinjiangensis TaxID=512350 RepID=A0A316F5H2_9ACTN|nr:AI-2E family transporter [Actinoplanes xinjiangensis]PWK40445.1 putative PurR-regulated permease PerM [Actinoplanes xinjiangensis]GIF42336.1 AI-2E family transporter [Actinoplanes xinjiangensis]